MRDGYINPHNIDDFYLPEEREEELQNDAEKPAARLIERKIYPPVSTIPEFRAEIVAQGTIDGFGEWALDEDGLLTIDGRGAMSDWLGVDAQWHNKAPWADSRWLSSIKKVEIRNGITDIGDYAFFGCTNLTSVIIPNSVTRIGDYAFRFCTSLKSISLPDSVTTVGRSAFAGCLSLAGVTMSDWTPPVYVPAEIIHFV